MRERRSNCRIACGALAAAALLWPSLGTGAGGASAPEAPPLCDPRCLACTAPEVLGPGSGLYWIVRHDCIPTTWSTLGPSECHGPPACPPGGRDGNLPPP